MSISLERREDLVVRRKGLRVIVREDIMELVSDIVNGKLVSKEYVNYTKITKIDSGEEITVRGRLLGNGYYELQSKGLIHIGLNDFDFVYHIKSELGLSSHPSLRGHYHDLDESYEESYRKFHKLGLKSEYRWV